MKLPIPKIQPKINLGAGDMRGKFSAWWNGVDYVAKESVTETVTENVDGQQSLEQAPEQASEQSNGQNDAPIDSGKLNSEKSKVSSVPKIQPKINLGAGDMRGKFSAWWNGVDYVAKEYVTETVTENVYGQQSLEQAPEQASEQSNGQNDAPIDSGKLNSEKLPVSSVPKIKNSKAAYIDDDVANYAAIEKLFGAGRVCPTNEEFDIMTVSEFNLPPKSSSENAKLYCFGIGSGGRLGTLVKKYNVSIEGYEENENLRKLATDYLKNFDSKTITINKFDKTPKSVPKNKAGIALIFGQGSAEEKLEGTCFSLARILNASGKAIWVDYFAKEGEEELVKKEHAGRSFFHESDFVNMAEAAGLKIIDSEDVGAYLLNSYYEKNEYINSNWDEIQAQLIKTGGINAANFALANIVTWKKRVEAIRNGQLLLKKILISAN